MNKLWLFPIIQVLVFDFYYFAFLFKPMQESCVTQSWTDVLPEMIPLVVLLVSLILLTWFVGSLFDDEIVEKKP